VRLPIIAPMTVKTIIERIIFRGVSLGSSIDGVRVRFTTGWRFLFLGIRCGAEANTLYHNLKKKTIGKFIENLRKE